MVKNPQNSKSKNKLFSFNQISDRGGSGVNYSSKKKRKKNKMIKRNLIFCYLDCVCGK